MFEQPFHTTFMTTSFSLFLLVKNNGERKRMRANKIIMWVWERKLSKNYHRVVVHISFLFLQIEKARFLSWKKKTQLTRRH